MSNLDSIPIFLCLRIMLALIFLTAAVGKFRHLLAFKGVLDNYRLLPHWALVPAQLSIPAGEIAIAVGILCFPAPAATIGAALLVVFAAAMAINLRRGRLQIDCGCHQSALRQRLSWTLIWRNGVLALLALAASLPQPRANLSSVLLGAAAGASLFFLYNTMNSLWAVGPVLRRRIRIAGVRM
jgi:uncharacterized membrane protein YphA (DoxX/SURF4 family)